MTSTLSLSDILYQRTTEYKVYRNQDLMRYFQECVNQLKEELGLPESMCYKILNKVGWVGKKAKLAAIEDGSLYDVMELEPQTNLEGDSFTCPVCWTTEKAKDGVSLSCKHYFCKDCFTGHLQSAITTGDNSFFLSCPWDGCKVNTYDNVYFNFV